MGGLDSRGRHGGVRGWCEGLNACQGASTLFGTPCCDHLFNNYLSVATFPLTLQPADDSPSPYHLDHCPGLIFLRAVDSIERDKWLHCLSQSISMYHEKQRLVEGLQQQGLLPPLGLGAKSRTTPRGGRLAPMLEGGTHGAARVVGGMPEASVGLDTVGLQLLPTGDVADIDVEQRRR